MACTSYPVSSRTSRRAHAERIFAGSSVPATISSDRLLDGLAILADEHKHAVGPLGQHGHGAGVPNDFPGGLASVVQPHPDGLHLQQAAVEYRAWPKGSARSYGVSRPQGLSDARLAGRPSRAPSSSPPVHALVVVPVSPFADVLPPGAVLEIPLHRGAQRVVEGMRRLPAQLAPDLRAVHGVAPVVAGAVLDVAGSAIPGLPSELEDRLHDLEVRHVVAAADVVDLAGLALAQDERRWPRSGPRT